jgi:hypothetical protein
VATINEAVVVTKGPHGEAGKFADDRISGIEGFSEAFHTPSKLSRQKYIH